MICCTKSPFRVDTTSAGLLTTLPLPQSGRPFYPARELTPYSGTFYLNLLLTQLGFRQLGMDARAQEGTGKHLEQGLPALPWALKAHAAFPFVSGGFVKPLRLHTLALSCPPALARALPFLCEDTLYLAGISLLFSEVFILWWFEQLANVSVFCASSSGYWRGLFSANSCSVWYHQGPPVYL